jgi:hypothetical protein
MFWTVLIIHYSMETLGITTLTHIAYSTEKKMQPSHETNVKGCSDVSILTLGRNVNQQPRRQ